MSPPEPDDAYTYILKSTQLAEGCALQDCPAPNSLRAQLQSKSLDEKAEWRRYRFSGRVFLVYHPLYSALLLGLNQAGLSWESGFAALSLFGALLIGAGVAFFATTLCGPLAAAALLLLAFSNFPGQGLTYIVPSNITLGLACFAFGFALRGWRWALVGAILAMLLMHPVGKVYSCAALLMAMLANRDYRLQADRLLPYVAATMLMGASVAVPMLIDQPNLRAEPEPVPPGFTLLSGLVANIARAAEIVASGFGREPVLGLPLALCLYLLAWRGYQNAPEPGRRRLLIAGLVLGGMCGALVLHVLPHYPAEAFQRGWIGLAVVLASAAGLAIAGPKGVAERLSHPAARHWRNPAMLGAGFLGVFVISGAVALAQQALKIRNRHYQTFEPDQVRLLAERCGTAVHASETSALFYLSHGANACPSTYLPAMVGDGDSIARLQDMPAPFMLVAPKPGPQEIAITNRHSAEITIREGGARKLHLLFGPVRQHPPLRIEAASAGQQHVYETAAVDTDGRIIIDLPPGGETKTVIIGTAARFASAFLEGIRLDDETTDWPWNRSVTLRSRRRVYAFSAPDLTSGLFPAMDVIDSRGSTLLAKLPMPNGLRR